MGFNSGFKGLSGKYLRCASSKAFVLSTLSCKLSETTKRSFDAMSLHLLLPGGVMVRVDVSKGCSLYLMYIRFRILNQSVITDNECFYWLRCAYTWYGCNWSFVYSGRGMWLRIAELQHVQNLLAILMAPELVEWLTRKPELLGEEPDTLLWKAPPEQCWKKNVWVQAEKVTVGWIKVGSTQLHSWVVWQPACC